MSAPNLPLNLNLSSITGHEARPVVRRTSPAPILQLAPRGVYPTRIAVVGNHLPRQCGIATFTTDLCDSIVDEFGTAGVFVVAINDSDARYEYPARVRLEIPRTNSHPIGQQPTSSIRAASMLCLCNTSMDLWWRSWELCSRVAESP